MKPVGEARVSQYFGTNPSGFNPSGGHTGTDYAVPVGTPVVAIADGVVKAAGVIPGRYSDNPWWILPDWAGRVVVIDHGQFLTVSAHLSSETVTFGQRVSAGQVVAYSGASGGASTGPHLHFEVLPDGYDLTSSTYGRIDPAPYLTGLIPASTSEPAQEDEMPLTDAEYNRIGDVVVAKLMTFQPLDKTNTLGELINEYRSHVLQTQGLIGKVPSAVLNAEIPRGGQMPGKTSLGALVSWNDDHVIQILAAAAASAASDGAAVDQIKDAVKQAFTESVVKVDVHIEGAKNG